MYKLIYLDADDTLFDYSAAEKFALENTFKKYNIIIDEEITKKYKLINKKLWCDYEKNMISQEKLRSERFRLLFIEQKLYLNESDVSVEYLQWLSEADFLIINAEKICKYLNEKYQLAIITNGICFVQRKRLLKSSINKYISHVIISEEAGFNKPDTGIFLYGEDITKVYNKEDILIIGDSLSSDIQGGINYGIHTCWFNQNKIENITKIQPTYEIHNLEELLNIL